MLRGTRAEESLRYARRSLLLETGLPDSTAAGAIFRHRQRFTARRGDEHRNRLVFPGRPFSLRG